MKHLCAKTEGQKEYIRAIQHNQLTFCIGPAGSGKTLIPTRYGMNKLLSNDYQKLVLTRPVVEAGERLGFLPGTSMEKMEPYLRPLYDQIMIYVEGRQFKEFLRNQVIEVVPLAHMRGRTLSNSFIILDEAQNCTREQLMMFLTRIGQGSKVVVNGDPAQSDLPINQRGGLVEFISKLRGVEGLAVIELANCDVVREPIVARILEALCPEEGPAPKGYY